MSQRSPEPLTGFQGVLLLHVREGKIGRKEREWMGNKRKGGGEGRERNEGGRVASWLWGDWRLWQTHTSVVFIAHFFSCLLWSGTIIDFFHICGKVASSQTLLQNVYIISTTFFAAAWISSAKFSRYVILKLYFSLISVCCFYLFPHNGYIMWFLITSSNWNFCKYSLISVCCVVKISWNVHYTDVDECAENNGGCSEFATCTNLLDSFYCTCNYGYTGDGFTCTGTIIFHNLAF